jgi:5'-deoxynucleotidase
MFVGMNLRSHNITRWPLMHSTRQETVAAHVFDTVIVGHLLAAVAVDMHGEKNIDPDKVASLCAHHEVSEAYGVGDLCSPVKYFDEKTTKAIKQVETAFENIALQSLPIELQARYQPLISQDKENDINARVAKIADVICAYAKCQFELKKSNTEFTDASKSLVNQIAVYAKQYPFVTTFMKVFIEGAFDTLDTQANDMKWLDNTDAGKLDAVSSF